MIDCDVHICKMNYEPHAKAVRDGMEKMYGQDLEFSVSAAEEGWWSLTVTKASHPVRKKLLNSLANYAYGFLAALRAHSTM